LVLSLLFNLLAVGGLALAWFLFWRGDSDTLPEHFHSGNADARHKKVAIIHLEGVLMEGLLGYAIKQIDTAARDPDVKAVVLRINSPGGTITASDDLYHRLVLLRDGTAARATGAKPLVVSMASLAASGGYYISMPAHYLFAEKTTITGSIGVYAAFPNIKELGDRNGFRMEVIKRGDVKDGGSPFKDMTPEERQVWQDMVDAAYQRFLAVIGDSPSRGRDLKGKLEDKVIDEDRTAPGPGSGKDGKPVKFRYVRRRADGGTYTAEQALKFKLIDEIGYLEDAIKKAADLAGLGDHYKVIHYERPRSLVENLLGLQTGSRPAALVDPGQLAAGLTPKLWYLAPQSELAGLAASMSMGVSP
jgi:protease-4